MGLNILSWSNSLTQYTGYATCQRQLLPRINRQSDHTAVQLACSGMRQAPPITIKGVKVYPKSEYGGNLGEQDIEHIVEIEDIDLLLTQLDVWAVAPAIQNLAESPQIPPMVVYAPVDHHGPEFMPAPGTWRTVFDAADRLVPYCEFGERVMLEQDVKDGKVSDPIFHGVDIETFQPDSMEISRGLGEDAFIVGQFKALQGTRGAHDRALRAFREFLEREDAWDHAYMYLHCSKQGSNTYNLPTLISEFGLRENVLLPSPPEYRWLTNNERMAGLYSSCDVVLNTARGEGFGLPILESMACGTPVIAGAYSSMPELVDGDEGEIRHDEVDDPVIDAPRGWMVPTWDERLTMGKHNYRRRYNREHIIQALQRAYNNPDARERKGQNGREFAQQHSWQHKAEEFLSLFDSLEDELWETDETTGVEWETIGGEGSEHGGVGGLGGVGDPT